MLHKFFSFQSSCLIFDLFLEHKINTFYTSQILNNLTKDTFSTNNNDTNSLKKLFVVKDIPNYLKLTLQKTNANIEVKKVNQYNGYLLNFDGYDNADGYVNQNLNRRNRKNLYSKKTNLYKNHKIVSTFFFGDIDKNNYDSIFDVFYTLLKNRFNQKQTHNRYLANWKELQTSTFQKILNKKASLHVVYDVDKPILITLNFHKSNIVFSHIQAYDINYSKYNMGDISMLNHVNWLMANNLGFFDLSMGKTYNKVKWSNHKYTFVYHIFYNKKSILTRIYAQIIAQELRFMQFLRNKNIIGKYINFDKFLYTLKSRAKK